MNDAIIATVAGLRNYLAEKFVERSPEQEVQKLRDRLLALGIE